MVANDIETALNEAKLYRLTGQFGKGVYTASIKYGGIQYFAIRDLKICASSLPMIAREEAELIQAWHTYHAPQEITWLELSVVVNVDRSHIREFLCR